MRYDRPGQAGPDLWVIDMTHEKKQRATASPPNQRLGLDYLDAAVARTGKHITRGVPLLVHNGGMGSRVSTSLSEDRSGPVAVSITDNLIDPSWIPD